MVQLLQHHVDRSPEILSRCGSDSFKSFDVIRRRKIRTESFNKNKSRGFVYSRPRLIKEPSKISDRNKLISDYNLTSELLRRILQISGGWFHHTSIINQPAQEPQKKKVRERKNNGTDLLLFLTLKLFVTFCKFVFVFQPKTS